MQLIMIWGAACVGLFLLLWSWRGRRVGDHRHCSGCGFDLFGSEPDALSCPECGRSLAHPRATLIGRRQRRWKVFAVGLVLVVAAASSGIARFNSDKGWYRHFPTACLLWIAHDLPARQELARRQRDGELTAGQRDQLIERALDVQADPEQTWEGWGNIIEDAFAAGKLSNEQLSRYARQGANLKLRLNVRPRVQVGRIPVCFVGHSGAVRLGPTTVMNCEVGVDHLLVRSQPVELTADLKQNAFNLTIGTGFISRQSHVSMKEVSKQLGPAEIEVEVVPKVSSITIGDRPLDLDVECPAQRLKATVQVTDTSTGNYIRQGFPPEEQSSRASVWIASQGDQRRLTVGFRQRNILRHVKTWLRVEGKAIPYEGGSYSYRQMDTEHFSIRRIPLEDLFRQHPELAKAKRADLIIRPDIRAAETYIDMPAVWLGEWVFEDIPLDAEPAHDNPLDLGRLPATLVPATARLLTLEEAEQPPEVDR